MEFVLGAAKLKSETPLIIRKPESQILKCMSAHVGNSIFRQPLCVWLGKER